VASDAARKLCAVTRVLLWRHGQTEYNADNRIQGQLDVALSALGRAQAAEVAPRLAALEPDALFSSDLVRAVDTMAPLVALTGKPVTYDERVRERHFGLFQGHTTAELADLYPAELAAWRAGDQVDEVGMEPRDVVAKRVASALHDYLASAPGGTIVVATHGGAAMQGTARVLGWPSELSRTVVHLGNCQWTDLRHDDDRGTWRLYAHNVDR
jgi:probable phosphoglycerate mutase